MASTGQRRVAIAAWIFVAVGIVQAVQALADALPSHAFDSTWLDHARFHVTMGVTNQLGFAIAAAAIALVPFRQRQRWSWWVLLAFALLSTVALIPAALWHGSGPPAGAWVLIAACIVAMIVALAMTADGGLRGRSSS